MDKIVHRPASVIQQTQNPATKSMGTARVNQVGMGQTVTRTLMNVKLLTVEIIQNVAIWMDPMYVNVMQDTSVKMTHVKVSA